MERKPVTGKCTEGNKSINTLKSDWISLYIAGEWIDRGNQPTIKDYDHYTQKVITEIPSATAEDVDKAFKAAERVQRTTTSSVWRLLNVSQSCEFHASSSVFIRCIFFSSSAPPLMAFVKQQSSLIL